MIYVIRGSEDGNIGASTNSTRAVEKALRYVNKPQTPDIVQPLARELRQKGFIMVEEKDDTWGGADATVEAFHSL